MNKKVKTKKEIIEIVKDLKMHGKKISAISGSFDILHLDHIESFREAKAEGDVLVVLLNSDQSVKKYKGSKRPINNQNIRAGMISALENVDYVVIFDEITPIDIIGDVKPDVFAQGSEWGINCIERKVVEDNGGKVFVLKHKINFSTSELIKKMTEVYSAADNKAVFLDRDGTININNPKYTHKIEDFKFAPGAISALKKLSKSDYKIIIVTNQSGIARGYYSEKDLKKLNTWMMRELRKQKIRIDKIYYCPHGPDDNCVCRKPKIGMFLRVVKDFDINLSKSWMIGDDQRDIIAGRQANIKTIKIGEKMDKSLKLEPNYYAESLLEAVDIVLT